MTNENVAYEAHIRVERDRGPMRRAWIPALEQPITFGVHGAIAEHYNVDPDLYPADATTIDYMIAAAAG